MPDSTADIYVELGRQINSRETVTNLDSAQRDVVFYLVPEFDILSFGAAIEALRVTNLVLGHEAYGWRVVSADGCNVRASCGLELQTDNSIHRERSYLVGGRRPDKVFVCSGSNVARYRDRAVDAWLRECSHRGVVLAALSSGAQVLATAGLLEDRRCVVHWLNFPAFVEHHTRVNASLGIYEIDGSVYTSAGGASSLDMMACIVSRDFGEDVFARVCQHLVADQVRGPTARQRLPLSRRLGPCNEVVLHVVRKMEENLADPMPMGELAAGTCLSRRQLERLFRREFCCSPARYYMNLRLEHAHTLLVQTKLPIVDVAIACGFVSASHFSKVYRENYSSTPQKTRIDQIKFPPPGMVPQNNRMKLVS